MQTILDNTCTIYPCEMYAITSIGRVVFHTDKSSKFAIAKAIKEQTGAKWVDIHHADLTIKY